MRRKPFIAGNWKMNGSRSSIRVLLGDIKSQLANMNDVQWLVFPPFVYIEQVARILRGTPISWGAQNLSAEIDGAHTGEVSATMLTDFECRYVLVGHSERRSLYGEDDALVAKKFMLAKQYYLDPVLCVGETAQERDSGHTFDVVTRQLNAVLSLSGGVEVFRNAVIAYEPVWAIGTGVTPTSKQVQEVHAYIRGLLATSSTEIAESLPIIYGGSLKPDNAINFFAMADVDGGLVGGASLNAQDFLEIGRIAKQN